MRLILAFIALFCFAGAQAQSPVLPGPGLTVASGGAPTVTFNWANFSDNTTNNTGTSFTVGSTGAATTNGTINSGDILLVVVDVQMATAVDPGAIAITGFTNITNTYNASQNPSHRISVWYKIAGASEPGTYTASWTGTPNAASWALLDYSGVNNSTPLDPVAASVLSNNSFSTNMATTAISPAASTNTLIGVWTTTGGKTPYAAPAGMTLRASVASSSSSRVEILIADLLLSSSGSTGVKTATAGFSVTSYGVLFALLP